MYFEIMKDNISDFWHIFKAMLRGKFITVNAYIKKKKDFKSVNYTSPLRNQEKNKLKLNKQKVEKNKDQRGNK